MTRVKQGRRARRDRSRAQYTLAVNLPRGRAVKRLRINEMIKQPSLDRPNRRNSMDRDYSAFYHDYHDGICIEILLAIRAFLLNLYKCSRSILGGLNIRRFRFRLQKNRSKTSIEVSECRVIAQRRTTTWRYSGCSALVEVARLSSMPL